MVTSEDGEELRAAIVHAGGGGAEAAKGEEEALLSAHAIAKCSTCAICQEEMIATTEAPQHGQSAPPPLAVLEIGSCSAPARLPRFLRARLAASGWRGAPRREAGPLRAPSHCLGCSS